MLDGKSMVIPAYNSNQWLRKSINDIEIIVKPLRPREIVLVDHISEDSTCGIIRLLCEKSHPVSGLRLSCNFGQHNALIAHRRKRKIRAVFHYQPLDTCPVGPAIGNGSPPLPNAAKAGQSLVSLSLYPDLSRDEQSRIIDALRTFRCE